MLRVLTGVILLCLVANSAAASDSLRKLSGWGELADLAQGKTVLFGDVHSKKGAGDTTVSYLQYLGTTRRSILIGIEISASEQSRLDAFMASDGSDAAISTLLSESPFWEHKGPNDGRPNASWLNVIKTARDMRANGQMVTLFAIVHSKPGVNWDGPSAKIFIQEMKAGGFDTAVVLAGGRHTIQAEFLLNIDYPFGHYFGSQNVISLNPNNLPYPSDFRVPNCPDADGKFTGIYLVSDVFAVNDNRKYDGAYCAQVKRSPNASPKTEAAYKKRLGRD